MGCLIFYIASVFVVVAVSSGFELYSKNLELTADFTKFKCFQEGRFSHPNTCGGYIECVRNTVGIFKRRFGSCHGGIFNETERHCTQSNEDNGCKRSSRIAREIQSDHRLSSLCGEIQNGFICADCKTAVNCVEGEAYPTTCGVGDMCDERPEFGGAVCYPGQAEACACNNEYPFHVDKYNPQVFFHCNSIGAEPKMYLCPEGRMFDIKTDQCINEMGLPECTAMGDFALHNNCSHYYTCILGKHGWVQKPFTCDNGLMFNEVTGICEDPCNWNARVFTCQEEGRFPDPTSCQHYFECIQQDQGFRQLRRQCPSGTEWNENALEGLGHCAKKVATTCKPVTVNTCNIPKSRCSESTDAGISTTSSSPTDIDAINEMKEQKASIESELLNQTRFLNLMEQSNSVLEELEIVVNGGLRTGARVSTRQEITLGESGQVTISPYCPSDTNSSITNTADNVIHQVISDMLTALPVDLNSLQCFNGAIQSFSNFILENNVVLRDPTELNELIRSAKEIVIALKGQVEINIQDLEARLSDIESQLAGPTSQLSLSELAIRLLSNRHTANTQPKPLIKSSGASNRPFNINSRWSVMNQGIRRSRREQSSK